MQGRQGLVLVVSVLCAMLPLSGVAQSAGKKAAITQSVAVIEDLLKTARPHITGANRRILSMQQRSGALLQIQSRMQNDVFQAEQAHRQSDTDLKNALAALYNTQTSALAIPAIAEMHQKLFLQVGDFTDQAIGGPRYVGGLEIQSLRPAMALVIDTEDRHLAHTGLVFRGVSDFLTGVRGELLAVAANPNGGISRFGSDHYLDRLMERIDALRLGVENVSTLLTGNTIEGEPGLPPAPCGFFFPFPDFPEELEGIRNLAETLPYTSTNPQEPTWALSVQQSYLIGHYDPDPLTQSPGWLSHWGACIASKANNVIVLNNEINRELLRGNIELAKQLDIQRAALSSAIVTLELERSTLLHRRNQINAIIASVAPQGTAQNLQLFPSAWSQTAVANIDNLEAIDDVFPALLLTSIELLERTRTELETLYGLSDPTELAAEIGLVIAKLDAIQRDGYSLVSGQFDSAHDSLRTMSIGIGMGGVALEEAIDVYSDATLEKSSFWANQVLELPNRTALAQADVTLARDTFNDSLQFVQELTAALTEFNDRRGQFLNSLNELVSRFSATRFNPLYTAMAMTIIEFASFSPKVEKLRPLLENAARALLGRFQGIVENETACRGRKCKVRIKNGVAKALKREAGFMKRDIRSAIEEAAFSVNGNFLFSEIENLEFELGELEQM